MSAGVPRSERKPRLRLEGGLWWCRLRDDHCLGVADSFKAAYWHWHWNMLVGGLFSLFRPVR